jgi:pimeloyl-ACP methyl ester carboxylesterase
VGPHLKAALRLGGFAVNARFPRRHAIGLIVSAPFLIGRQARSAPRAIDESGFVPIGGIDQWISIRGRDVANPAILYLHGGPGEAQSPFPEHFVPWESDFTVVNWDQRGAGKTFARNGGSSTPGMSTPESAFDRMCQDVREVAELACSRLKQKKVVLVGQSWGTQLGFAAMMRWPQLFHAYVGTAHVVSWTESINGQERWKRQQAIAANDRETLTALDEAAKLPLTDLKRYRTGNRYRFGTSDLEYIKSMNRFTGAPPFPKQGEVADWFGGMDFSSPRLGPVISSYDARKLGLDIPIPFFVIQGRDDHVTPFEAAERYVAEVRAPVKKFIAIEGGHFACFTNPTEFVGALRQHVRPLTKTRR